MVSQFTKFEVSRFTRYELRSYEWQCKMQKMGWFGVVRGHSSSSAMSPFDRAHTTSYSTLIETMCLSFTVFTARCVLLVVILPITTQQCRNYLYDKS